MKFLWTSLVTLFLASGKFLFSSLFFDLLLSFPLIVLQLDVEYFCPCPIVLVEAQINQIRNAQNAAANNAARRPVGKCHLLFFGVIATTFIGEFRPTRSDRYQALRNNDCPTNKNGNQQQQQQQQEKEND